MFGAISRRTVTGRALPLAAFLATDAADIDGDLPELADQIGRMASEGRKPSPLKYSSRATRNHRTTP